MFWKCFYYFLKVFNNILIFKQISNFNNFSKHRHISYLFKMFAKKIENSFVRVRKTFKIS